jgi:DNA-binding NarL/FixJ family response regulator
MTLRRLVLVEDDPSVRSFVEMVLSTEPDLELVGSVDSAEEAIALVAELLPDLVLLDNQLVGPMTGLQAAPQLKAAAPSVVVLLCTALDLAGAADGSGSIDGFLRKDNLVDLVDIVRDLLDDHPPHGA